MTSDLGDPSQMDDQYHEMGRRQKCHQAALNEPSQKMTCITRWV